MTHCILGFVNGLAASHEADLVHLFTLGQLLKVAVPKTLIA